MTHKPVLSLNNKNNLVLHFGDRPLEPRTNGVLEGYVEEVIVLKVDVLSDNVSSIVFWFIVQEVDYIICFLYCILSSYLL